MVSATVMTVLGPVPATALGLTMAHEHVFFDLGCYFSQAEDDPQGAMADAPVEPSRLWWLRAHPMNNHANLVQDDLETAVAEVAAFKAAGGGTLVDVTTVGIAPHPRGLAEVARRTGVHIVAGTGFYVAPSYEALAPDMSVEALADYLRRELLEGIAGTDVRAGLIGELGVGNPPAPVERRVLEAAARVQRELDCAVSLHPAWGAEGALLAAQVAEEVGLNPRRTALCHLDNRFRDDLALYRDVGRRGFFLDLDCFGRDTYYPHVNTQLPADSERIRTVLGLLDAGLGRQVLFAQDICFRHELVRYGGYGYAHVLRTIRPRLLRHGVDAAALEQILVHNPQSWLAGETYPPSPPPHRGRGNAGG
ncbi:MAG: phosphotriesterase family protein, partial [Chloroflexota bacterium]